MSIITAYEGRRGASGTNGDNGSGVADIRESLIDNPVLSILNANNKSKFGTLTSTRATMGAYPDRYGNGKLQNPDTATNLVLHSTDFSNGVWADTTASWTYIGTTTDPYGGSLAHEINLDVDTRNDVTYDQIISQTIATIASNTFVMSVWMKAVSYTHLTLPTILRV